MFKLYVKLGLHLFSFGKKQMTKNPKDYIVESEKSRLVCEIPCRDCDAVYIGGTGRSLKRPEDVNISV